MSVSNTAANWVKFFIAAGIPNASAASYSHIFVDNRIKIDMLMDLNKEYLREMGINPMGDIIAILRHSKMVTEQHRRESVLSSESSRVPMAAVSASKVQVAPAISSRIIRLKTESPSPPMSPTVSSIVKPRRVLPEHEGRYKITLPLGTTPRSKQILAKKSMLQSDKITQKISIFNRLGSEETDKESSKAQIVKFTNSLKSPPSSVFNRLGDKSSDELSSEDSIYKGSPKTTVRSVKTMKNQTILFVNKIPAKATMQTDDYDSYDEEMELGENHKSVSFSPQDEVVEIAPRSPKRLIVKPRIGKPTGKITVKARLGLKDALKRDGFIHGIKKTIKLKPESPIKSPLRGKLKSDAIIGGKANPPIRNRLDFKKKANLLAERVGKVSLSSKQIKKEVQQNSGSGSSVFNRLG